MVEVQRVVWENGNRGTKRGLEWPEVEMLGRVNKELVPEVLNVVLVVLAKEVVRPVVVVVVVVEVIVAVLRIRKEEDIQYHTRSVKLS
jgi:hypothetical protein